MSNTGIAKKNQYLVKRRMYYYSTMKTHGFVNSINDWCTDQTSFYSFTYVQVSLSYKKFNENVLSFFYKINYYYLLF